MGQKDFVLSGALVIIFSISLVTFLSLFGAQNSAVINIGNDSALGEFATDINASQSTYNLEVNGTSVALGNTTIPATGETTETAGVIDKRAGTLSAFKNILETAADHLFDGDDGGFSPILMTILGAIGMIFALYVWKTWRGNPD